MYICFVIVDVCVCIYIYYRSVTFSLAVVHVAWSGFLHGSSCWFADAAEESRGDAEPAL